MSTGGQIVGGIVGAVVGYYVGGPVGALQGAALGAGVGGYLDPPKGPTVSGPRLSDLSVQTSTYGAFIPRLYGTIAVHGNLLWLENNKLKERVRKESQGGKGGGSSTTVKTYTYSATFALGLCQGPIAGVRRIWCGDKLLYNAGSDDLETIIASNKNAKGWRLYLGTDDQMPDTRYEADVGVGNAPAFRGIAYLVFEDFQLADYSNTLQVAQFKVEIVTEAASSVELAGSIAIPYSQPHDSVSFLPKPYYLAEDRVIFYAPQWDANYPDSSAWLIYQCFPSGGSDISYRPVFDPFVPPNGDTDDDEEAWTDSVFPSATTTGPGGYQQRRGEHYAALSNNGGRKLWTGKYVAGLAGYAHSTTTTADCFAIAGGLIYAFCPDGVRVYDEELSLVSTSLFSMPSLNYPNARAELSGENFYIYDGDSIIYRVPASLSGFSNHAMVPPPPDWTYYSQTVNMSGNMLVRAFPDYDTKELVVQWYSLEKLSQANIPLSQIVQTEASLSGLIHPADIDVSDLTDGVRGYRVMGGSIRSAIEPLQGAFPFGVIPSGYQIKCVPRGQSSVATIPWEDLGAADGDQPGDILPQSREMDSQLPARTNITYLDAVREYAESEQYAERINTPAINRVDRELPLVITADEAAGVAEVLQNLAWLERSDMSFTLPPIYLPLEASDVVTLTLPDATYEVRLTEASYSPSGRLECKAKPNRAALYAPAASGGEAPGPDGTVPLGGPSLFVPLDIPVVDETSQNSPGFVGAVTGFTEGWPGAVVVRSDDQGQTWQDVQGFVGKATLGRARTALSSSPCWLIDPGQLVIDMISGEISSITRDQMLTGSNFAAYGVDGRWEIVRFQNAVVQADGSYLVSAFVRGDKGTEWAAGLHQVGDLFIPLADPDLIFIGSATEAIGIARDYRGVTSGTSVDDASNVIFAYQGVNLEPLSAVSAKAVRDGSGNLSANFYRRSRLSSSWWGSGVPAPVGEAAESYEIDVMSGATVKRTISVSTTAFSYTAADQTTDFGSPQSSITFRIYQLSEVVGRGYVREVIL